MRWTAASIRQTAAQSCRVKDHTHIPVRIAALGETTRPADTNTTVNTPNAT